jgi:CubicO group peptidase (beta-lactamase class C family)
MTHARFFAESPEEVGVDSSKLLELFARAEKEVKEGLLPAVQVAVARRGKIAGMRSFGAATDTTLFTVFSATKAITSAAIWLLLQERKLRLDELVADILPGFGENGKDRVTVLHLLLHTAGFPYAPLGHPEWSTREARLARYRRWRLSWDTGSRYEYHPTSGMWVLSDIVTERSGQDFRAFVRERIALPLGLDDLWVGLPRELDGRVADIVHVGAEPTDEELAAIGAKRPPQTEVNEETLNRFNDPDVRAVGVPGGGGLATAAEIALLYQAFLTGRAPDGAVIWQPETLALARTVLSGSLVDPISGVAVNRGLGIVIAGDEKRNFRGFGRTGSPLMFGHNGAGGQLAFADPESGLSLGYVTNGMDRHFLRQGRRGVAIASRAAICLQD